VVGSHDQENGEQERSQGQNSSTQNYKIPVCSKLLRASSISPPFLVSRMHLQSLLRAAEDIFIKWYCQISYPGQQQIFSNYTYLATTYMVTTASRPWYLST
jgi:hypothetical protein